MQTNVCVRNGKIAALTNERPSARRVIDVRGKYVFPGIIDPHTHLGLYAPLETELETETRSALLGGVTTIGTFFNHTGSYLPTIAKLSREIPQYSRINIIPHFTLRDDEQLRELPLYSARGMNSFKVYMCGVKGIYPHQDDGFIFDAMQRLKALPADPVLCIHAENTYIVDRAEQRLLHLRPAGSRTEQPQPRRDLIERQRHAQQAAARVQAPGPARAQLGLQLPRKAREGQHLREKRQARPRDPRKLALGLVAILLRHQQHAPALSGERRAAYLVHDQRGFARARPARYESQHVLASLGPTIIP